MHANVSPFYLEKRLASPINSDHTFHVFSLLLASVLGGLNEADSIGTVGWDRQGLAGRRIRELCMNALS